MIRKRLIAAFVAVAAAIFVGGGYLLAVESAKPTTLTATAANETDATKKSATTSSADEVLKQLLAGNERFVKGELQHPRRTPDDFRAVAKAQYPVAVIVACADSRVAPELLFDMGVGDLFVIRVAGNVVDGAGVTVKGSIEYAIAELHVPLIVVLGHSNCGAVKSAVAHIDHKDSLPGAINGLVELIKPAVLKVQGQAGDIYANATRENVKIGVEKLKNLQPILAPGVKKGSVKVIGGVYDLHTGKVELLPSEPN
ncbi:MAG: carbonic anhydrase [Pirellulales bacterium]